MKAAVTGDGRTGLTTTGRDAIYNGCWPDCGGIGTYLEEIIISREIIKGHGQGMNGMNFAARVRNFAQQYPKDDDKKRTRKGQE
ncbi:hypothetical protein NDU88_012137 [Pleurodeles waltl]|uniref:Uncharacterized protein n=1 Tax=Pleurodeles waltl TaxID=8319 RepID=A0AAV7R148_PLEWA|nr:hypothetical protein NDU88_012137 [Pleurodeles waltl]